MSRPKIHNKEVVLALTYSFSSNLDDRRIKLPNREPVKIRVGPERWGREAIDDAGGVKWGDSLASEFFTKMTN